MQSPPTPEELEAATGERSVWEVLDPKRPKRQGGGRIPRRASAGLVEPKTRPLEDKVEAVLEQLFIPMLCTFYEVPTTVRPVAEGAKRTTPSPVVRAGGCGPQTLVGARAGQH